MPWLPSFSVCNIETVLLFNRNTPSRTAWMPGVSTSTRCMTSATAWLASCGFGACLATARRTSGSCACTSQPCCQRKSVVTSTLLNVREIMVREEIHVVGTSTCIVREDKGFNSGQTVSQHCVATANKRYFYRGDLWDTFQGAVFGVPQSAQYRNRMAHPKKQDRMTSVGNNLHRNPINKTATNLYSCTCVTSVPTGSTHWDPRPHGPRCCRLYLSLLCLMWMCSHRAPRTKVSMWITSTARRAVCHIVGISWLNFFRREPWGF